MVARTHYEQASPPVRRASRSVVVRVHSSGDSAPSARDAREHVVGNAPIVCEPRMIDDLAHLRTLRRCRRRRATQIARESETARDLEVVSDHFVGVRDFL